jgi:hypothetical protein
MSSRWFALLRSAFFATLFVALWIWFIPRWIAVARGVTLELRTNAAALALMIVGAAIMVRCVFDRASARCMTRTTLAHRCRSSPRAFQAMSRAT